MMKSKLRLITILCGQSATLCKISDAEICVKIIISRCKTMHLSVKKKNTNNTQSNSKDFYQL